MTIVTLEKKIRKYREPIQNRLLKRLYELLPPMPVSNKQMNRAYVNVAGILMEELEIGRMSRANRIAIEKYLSAIVPFIEKFEKREYPHKPVTPEEVLHFLMEQNRLTQSDLSIDMGGQSVVSDILRGKRKLSREHIERLSRRFHMSPATFYPMM